MTRIIMSIEDRLRQRLEKAERLFFGAATTGERDAAEAAIERLKAKLAESARQDPAVEMKFSLPDAWSVKLFVALCRRYGLLSTPSASWFSVTSCGGVG